MHKDKRTEKPKGTVTWLWSSRPACLTKSSYSLAESGLPGYEKLIILWEVAWVEVPRELKVTRHAFRRYRCSCSMDIPAVFLKIFLVWGHSRIPSVVGCTGSQGDVGTSASGTTNSGRRESTSSAWQPAHRTSLLWSWRIAALRQQRHLPIKGAPLYNVVASWGCHKEGVCSFDLADSGAVVPRNDVQMLPMGLLELLPQIVGLSRGCK